MLQIHTEDLLELAEQGKYTYLVNPCSLETNILTPLAKRLYVDYPGFADRLVSEPYNCCVFNTGAFRILNFLCYDTAEPTDRFAYESFTEFLTRTLKIFRTVPEKQGLAIAFYNMKRRLYCLQEQQVISSLTTFAQDLPNATVHYHS